MRFLLKIDDYFIGNDEGTVGCRVKFYGQYALYIGIVAFMLLSI